MSKTSEGDGGSVRVDGASLSRTVSEGEFNHTIIEMVAALEGTEPHKTSFQLHEYVDGEALDSLLASSSTELEVTFTVEDYRVTVDSTGSVDCRSA
jgi:hypothetical protein